MHRQIYPDRARAISASGRLIDGFDPPVTSGDSSFKELLAGNGPDEFDLEGKLAGPHEHGRWRGKLQDTYRWRAR